MVDFKRASEAKNLKIKCEGFVNDTQTCTNEATCWFEFYQTESPENMGEACLCESCFRKLFPDIGEESIEDAKLDMFGYKYRKLGTP